MATISRCDSLNAHSTIPLQPIAPSMPPLPRIILKPRRARPFFARHPWVLDSSIERIDGEPEAGSEVELHSHEGRFIARGLFNPRSTIRVRLYRWEDAPLDDAFWSAKLESAIRLRRETLGLDRPEIGCRLVFSEGDGLSGLTVDRYDRWLIAHLSSFAIYERRALILDQLRALTGVEGIVARGERGTSEKEGIPAEFEEIVGTLPETPVSIVENELSYRVDLARGQKTGFYLDQRDNRRAVAPYCRDRRVLDLFCFTGGFALNALRHGGAASVLGVDGSSPAIDQARENAAINSIDRVEFEEGKVLPVLERLKTEARRFGVVICDPPKFAQRGKDVDNALKGYLRLNQAALDVLEPDGILVTCSCSGSIDRGLFAQLLGQVAEQSGRTIQILDQRGQPPDHPVSASCLETEYLKCFICRVGG